MQIGEIRKGSRRYSGQTIAAQVQRLQVDQSSERAGGQLGQRVISQIQILELREPVECMRRQLGQCVACQIQRLQAGQSSEHAGR